MCVNVVSDLFTSVAIACYESLLILVGWSQPFTKLVVIARLELYTWLARLSQPALRML